MKSQNRISIWAISFSVLAAVLVEGQSTSTANPGSGPATSGAAWNDPFNPAPSITKCPTCPPAFANGASDDGSFPPLLNPFAPPGGGGMPSFPGENATGNPSAPFEPGGCVFVHCWSIEDVLTTGVPGGYKDKLVEAFNGTGPCGSGPLPANADCSQFATPCIGNSQTGECTLEALKKMCESQPNQPIDPDNPTGPKWGDFCDGDGDGTPNIFDLFPKGPIGVGPINPSAIVPTDPDKLKLLLEEMGVNPALIDILASDPSWNPGAGYTAAELFTDLKHVIEVLNAKLQQAFDQLQSKIADLQNADLSYKEQWDAMVAALDEFLSDAKAIRDLVWGFKSLAEYYPADFFGGQEAKDGFLAILQGMYHNLIENSLDLKPLLAQASDISAAMQAGDFKVALKIDGKEGPALQLLQEIPPALESALQHPEGSPFLSGSVEGPPNQGPEEKIPPLFPNQDVPLVSTSTVGDPVDTWSGELVHKEVDLSVPGRGLDFAITRTYRSRSMGRGIFGSGWISPLEARLLVFPDSTTGQRFFVLESGDGSQRGFRYDGGAAMWLELQGGFAKIQKDTAQTPWTPATEQKTNGFVLRESNGNFLHFCPPSLQLGDIPVPICWLKKISDPYGNAIVFDRDALGRVQQVTDTLGRRYQFSYAGDRLLREIVGPEGLKIVYEYDRENLLPPGEVGESISGGVSATGGSQAGGLGAKHPPYGGPVSPEPEFKTRDLVAVRYWPAVPVLENSGVITMKPRAVRYSYAQDPAGFVEKPGSSLNHNLAAVFRDDQGPAVQFAYYSENPNTYEFDRVKSYTVAGLTTRYRYSDGQEVDPGNPYGQTIKHRTEVFFPQTEGSLGFVERFDHDEKGNLLRHEIRDGLYDSDFALANASPNSVGAFVTLMAYNEDRLLVEEVRTSETGFLAGKKRVTQFTFDSDNPDRFQQGRLLQVKAIPDPTVPSDFPELVSTFTYEPIRGELATRTDALGRTTKYVYQYQESNLAEVIQWLGVKQWGIDLFSTPMGLGDLNGDRKSTQRGFALIRKEFPSVEVASPNGPGSPSSKTPTEMWTHSIVGQILEHLTVDQKTERNEYRNGLLSSAVIVADGQSVVSQMEYDALGRQTVLIAPDGSRTQTQYDAAGHTLELAQLPIPGTGEETIVRRFFYDLAGHLVGESNPCYASQAPVYASGLQPALAARSHYNAVGQQISRQVWIDTPLGMQTGTWQMAYDSRSRVEKVTSPSKNAGASLETAGIVTRIERDARGFTVARHRFAENGASLGSATFEYSAYGEPTRAVAPVDSDGDGSFDQLQSFYDGYGRLIGDVSALGARGEYTLDAAGRMLHARTFDAANHLWDAVHASYDNNDLVLEVYEENFETLPNGQLVTLFPAELRTRHGYDIAGRLLWSLDDPNGKAYLRRMEYDGLGRAKAAYANVQKEMGVRVFRDAVGRILEVHRQHDALSQTGAVDPSESVTRFTYDGHGRLKTRSDAAQALTQFLEYSAAGQPGRVIDPRGNQALASYDSAGRPWQETEIGFDGLTRAEKSEYDLFDLTASIDPKNQRTQYVYDDLRRVSTVRYADQSEQRYTVYDFADRLLQMVKPDGSLFVMQYNAASQLTDVQANSAVSSSLSVHRQYEYDVLGRQKRVEDRVGAGPAISILRRRSSSDLLLEQMQSAPAFGWNRSFSMEFDSAGQAKKILYPSGFFAGLDYDSMGRWQTISASGSTVATRTVAYGSSYKEVVLGNGAKIRQSHDTRGLVLERELRSLSQQTLFGERYGYDANRNLTTRARLQNGALDWQESFAYDGFDRLSQWDLQGGNGALPRTQSFQHDVADNLTQFSDLWNGTAQTQTGDFSNALNQCEAFAPLYSSMGFTGNGEQSNLLLQDGAKVLLQWDALGRVAHAQKLTASGSIEISIQYYWDGENQLFARLESSGYAQFFERLQGEILGSQDTQAGHFDYLRDPSGNAFFRSRGNEQIYFLHDPQLNPRVALAQDGHSVLERYQFTPFGERFDPQNASANFASSPVDMQMSYLDQPRDRALGLHFLGERLYDAKMGRFLSRDPLGAAGSQSSNLYSYARRNPLRFHDRSGLSVAQTQNPASEGNSWWSSVTSAVSNAWDFTKQEVIPRAIGLLQAAGGVYEMTLGSSLVLAGAATTEVGVGVLGIVAGGAMLVHGGDNAWAGVKMLWTGQPQSTTTELLLQKAGMSPTGAAITNGVVGGAATFLASGGATAVKQALTLPPTVGPAPVLAGSAGTLATGLVGEAGAASSGTGAAVKGLVTAAIEGSGNGFGGGGDRPPLGGRFTGYSADESKHYLRVNYGGKTGVAKVRIPDIDESKAWEVVLDKGNRFFRMRLSTVESASGDLHVLYLDRYLSGAKTKLSWSEIAGSEMAELVRDIGRGADLPGIDYIRLTGSLDGTSAAAEAQAVMTELMLELKIPIARMFAEVRDSSYIVTVVLNK